MWITQRLAKLDEMTMSQLGGFGSDASLNKIGGRVGYPKDVHKVGHGRVAGLSEELHAPDDGPVSVRRWTDEGGKVTGSEWIYSDDEGNLDRMNSGDLELSSTHYGPESLALSKPG